MGLLFAGGSRVSQIGYDRRGTPRNDMELVHRPHQSYSKLKVNVTESEGGRTFKSCDPDRLLYNPVARYSRSFEDG